MKQPRARPGKSFFLLIWAEHSGIHQMLYQPSGRTWGIEKFVQSDVCTSSFQFWAPEGLNWILISNFMRLRGHPSDPNKLSFYHPSFVFFLFFFTLNTPTKGKVTFGIHAIPPLATTLFHWNQHSYMDTPRSLKKWHCHSKNLSDGIQQTLTSTA